ncbi:MAG: hypothetical protein ABI548_04065 [Polyangiaceae bacterium]
MVTIEMLDERVLHQFPEAAVLLVLDAALAATELALRVEHPTVDDLPFDPQHEIAPSLLTAHLVLSRSAELRHLLQLYSAAVLRAIADEQSSDAEDWSF